MDGDSASASTRKRLRLDNPSPHRQRSASSSSHSPSSQHSRFLETAHDTQQEPSHHKSPSQSSHRQYQHQRQHTPSESPVTSRANQDQPPTLIHHPPNLDIHSIMEKDNTQLPMHAQSSLHEGSPNGDTAPLTIEIPESSSPEPEPDPSVIQVESYNDGVAPQSAVQIGSDSPRAPSPDIDASNSDDGAASDSPKNVWRPYESPVGVQRESYYLAHYFPHFQQNFGFGDALEFSLQVLERGSDADDAVFVSVKAWMRKCLLHLSHFDHDRIIYEREMWDEIPIIIEALLKRSIDLQPDEGRGPFACLESFFVIFAQLALRMVQFDLANLIQNSRGASREPELASIKYLPCLSWILQVDNIPFFRALKSVHGVEVVNMIARMNEKLLQQPNSLLQRVSQFSHALLAFCPRFTDLGTAFCATLNIFHALVSSTLERRTYGADESLAFSPTVDNVLESSYTFFRSVDDAYQEFISKKAAWVTNETSESILRNISSAYHSIAVMKPEMPGRMMKDLGIRPPDDVTLELWPEIVYWGWKLHTLKRHFMEGRMELRVYGVERLQQDLVDLFRQYVHNNPKAIENPVVKYVVKFLRDIKITEYLLGIDSHPQLVARSANIIGFLVVTGCYTNEDTDTIWRIVTESQDQRIVAEILKMLSRTFPPQARTNDCLLYMCQKLMELPLERFDGLMLDYCGKLLCQIRDKQAGRSGKSNPDDTTQVDTLPYELCVRLIRETSSVPSLTTEQKAYLQNFASNMLFSFFDQVSRENEGLRFEMYGQCIKDISKTKHSTVGNIQALNSLMPVSCSNDLHKLAVDHDFTRLFVEELAQYCDDVQSSSTEADVLHELAPRFQLLRRMVDFVPETLTTELCKTLWNRVFMSNKIGAKGRNLAWDVLSKAMKSSIRGDRRNPFLETILNEYLPHVPPQELTFDILSVAEEAIHYDLRFNDLHTGRAKNGEEIVFPGMERIWTMILTSPPGSIEYRAIDFAVALYLDHPLMKQATQDSKEATYISLVNRCVSQIASAAEKGKVTCNAASDNTESTPEVEAEQLRFSRSLLFLRHLLHGLRSRSYRSPSQNNSPALPPRAEESKGVTVQIFYQIANSNSPTPIHALQIGDLCTGGQLYNKLSASAGFTKFGSIVAGQRVDLLGMPGRTIRDMRLPNAVFMIVNESEAPQSGPLTAVDTEVLKSFDELYHLLELNDNLAREIFDFLMIFPPHERIKDFVRLTNTSAEEVFPPKKPFKLLYSLQALISCLREDYINESCDGAFVMHSVQVLTACSKRQELFPDMENTPLKMSLACYFIECLLFALRAVGKTNKAYEGKDLFTDPGLLVSSLVRIISLDRPATLATIPETSCCRLLTNAFECLVDASFIDERVWNKVVSYGLEKFISSTLINEPHWRIRQGVADIVMRSFQVETADTGTTETAARSLSPMKQKILSSLWECIKFVPPQNFEHMNVLHFLFEAFLHHSPQPVDLGAYFNFWSNTLLAHKTSEFVGREIVDFPVYGLSRLLQRCLELGPAADILSGTENLMEGLFTSFLFPRETKEQNDDSDSLAEPPVPIMHENTRKELYKLFLLVYQDVGNCKMLLSQLSDIIPHDYTYDSAWCFEREKTIRAPEGYAGLRNLSNTCYLNSLFMQLFMNVEFRDFMLSVPLVGENENKPSRQSQKEQQDALLLTETKRLFSLLQNTWQRSVDPSDTVDSIRTYDNEPIDISIQMDVDEFYNLLFDRWEAQLKSENDKKKLRSFYGGQLVQQIKSQECEHISERLEPFSAIQCEIKGKSSLEESLSAYVEGEIMQGDNKYSCTSCGRHVDAVKRACLKDVPDHLIFHLKRFDFDVITMMRSKINDEFRFPSQIDMSQYKIDYLSDPSQPVDPDIFELVGVLVHSGTAESGHYYSYMREHPTADNSVSWVEFNDADVSRFDPAKIPDQCFGGTNAYQSGSMNFPKPWNAYMLFYQRVIRMDKERSLYNPQRDMPVHVNVPRPMAEQINVENELFLRAYCLLSPEHSNFVLGLLQQSRFFIERAGKIDDSTRQIRRSAIHVALDTIDQLIIRTKDPIDLRMFIVEIASAIGESPENAVAVIDWVNMRESCLRNMVLKCQDLFVKKNVARMICTALKRLEDAASDDNTDEADRELNRKRYLSCLESTVANVDKLWSILHLFFRSWDSYFELVIALMDFGDVATQLILEQGFLQRCLELVWLDSEDTKKLKRHYTGYCRLLGKGRKFSHYAMFELLALLLSRVHFALPACSKNAARQSINGKFALSEAERHLVYPRGSNGELVVMKKVISRQANPDAAHKLIQIFFEADAETELPQLLCRTIEMGLESSPAELAAPFLEATLVVSRISRNVERIIYFVDLVCKDVETINDSGGLAHLTFFKALTHLENPRLGKDSTWFTRLATERIPEYVPTLASYGDRRVRNETLILVRDALLSVDLESNDINFEAVRFYAEVGRQLAKACAMRLRKVYAIVANNAASVNVRQLDTLVMILKHCQERYFDVSISEDATFVEQVETLLRALSDNTVETQDDAPSDQSEMWEDQSVVNSDSDTGVAGSP